MLINSKELNSYPYTTIEIIFIWLKKKNSIKWVIVIFKMSSCLKTSTAEKVLKCGVAGGGEKRENPKTVKEQQNHVLGCFEEQQRYIVTLQQTS